MWKQISICPDWQCDDRIWHAGLSEDGTKCFVAGFDDHIYIVWDIEHHSVIWRDEGSGRDSESLPLGEWIGPDGCIDLTTGPAHGRYRIFGLNFNYAKIESPDLNQVLEVDEKEGVLSVRARDTHAIINELPFDAFSGDWAFASFSDNDAVIAVVEPYSVTFFGRA
ncbi:MAG TPA: hypothetical protein VMF69_01600 [Gemmataceae bacterium]|nr:hypothetical protein [Gemmataceae bacterium]